MSLKFNPICKILLISDEFECFFIRVFVNLMVFLATLNPIDESQLELIGLW